MHTLDLPGKNASLDGLLNDLSMAEMRVVVTKDTDFFYSHLLQGRPWKLVMVRTGNMNLRATMEMFQKHLPALVQALETCTLVELERHSVTTVI